MVFRRKIMLQYVINWFNQILAYCLDTLLIICILHTDSAAVCMSCWKWRIVGLKYRLWSLVDIMPYIFGYLSYVINGFLSVESTINMVHPLPQISNLSIPFHIIFHQKRCQRTVRHLVWLHSFVVLHVLYFQYFWFGLTSYIDIQWRIVFYPKKYDSLLSSIDVPKWRYGYVPVWFCDVLIFSNTPCPSGTPIFHISWSQAGIFIFPPHV